ncbi:MAG: zinc-ribbon domain-containing protein [Fusicatenibacter sp.]
MNLIKGVNDLKTLYPVLAEEWDYEKNYPLRPEDVTVASAKTVYWICKEGHGYPAKIYSRTKEKGTNCPYCAGKLPIKGVNDLLTMRPEIAAEWDYEKSYPLRPEDVTVASGKTVYWRCKEGHSYPTKICSRTNEKGTGCPYCAGRLPIKGVNDLLTMRPKIAAEWDYEKNYPLKPENVMVASRKKVYWRCKEGHSYPAKIYNRTKKKGTGCPYCAGRLPIRGVNDLLTLYPNIVVEWDYEKNYPLRPEDVTAKSIKKVWWTCKEGHMYKASIGSRTRGSGCPYCAGKSLIKGVNDLLTVYPDIATEWNYEKNRPLCPENVTIGSEKKVWWTCKEGHMYKAVIYSRTKGTGCPYCAGKSPIKGVNDLLTMRPEIAAEWDYERNYPLRPEDVMVASGKKVYWICKEGHIHKATIKSRTKGADCPYCAGKLPIEGVNDLLTIRPEIAAEWDYEKNYPSRPEDVMVASRKKVYWICKEGHSYPAKICDRTKEKGTNCPYCAGKLPIKGVNDLMTKYPDVCKDWDYEKNKKHPDEYLPYTGYNVYWKCHKCGNAYRRRIVVQVKGLGCKNCR